MNSNTSFVPLEIVEHITTYLPINDRLLCLLVCKAWHAYLYRTIIRIVIIRTRKELKSFTTYLDKYKDIGYDVREIHFKKRVGLTPKEFVFICQTCPLLEVFKFTTWQDYKKDSFCSLTHLKQIPKLYDQEKAYNAIATCGNTLTHLELSELLLRRLIPRRDHLTLLQFTTQLTHLRLDGVFSLDPDGHDVRRMEFDYTDWNYIHQHCSHLQHLSMARAYLKASSIEAKDMQSVTHVAPSMKHLVLRSLYLNNPVWIHYLAFMYPNLEELEIDFGIGCFVTITADQTSRLDTIECHTGFLILAHELKKLKVLTLRGLKQTHFPGTFFFNMLTTRGIQLEQATIAYDTSDFSSSGMNVFAYDSLLKGQHKTLKTLELDIWEGGAYEDVFKFMIEPLSLCTQLTRLSLWNDDFNGYYYNAVPLDLILNTCTTLLEISLTRIALCIENKHMKAKHSLRKLNLIASRISQPIFDYLAIKCPKLNYMALVSCSWMPREIEMKIDMPHHTFEFIRITDLNRRKTTALEGNLVQGHTVNLFSITQLDKIQKKKDRYKSKNIEKLISKSTWYHLYEPPPLGRFYIPSFIRKLNEKQVMTCYYLTEYFKDNQHLSKARHFQELETRYLGKKYWKCDVASGYVHITCKSLKNIKYNFNVITYK